MLKFIKQIIEAYELKKAEKQVYKKALKNRDELKSDIKKQKTLNVKLKNQQEELAKDKEMVQESVKLREENQALEILIKEVQNEIAELLYPNFTS